VGCVMGVGITGDDTLVEEDGVDGEDDGRNDVDELRELLYEH